MFAVPGWSLGPLKAESPQDATPHANKSSKKRKRKTAQPNNGNDLPINKKLNKNTPVTNDNVAELWDRHVRQSGDAKGSTPERTQNRASKMSKSQTFTALSDSPASAVSSSQNDKRPDKADPEKPGKKRKRKQKNATEREDIVPEGPTAQEIPSQAAATSASVVKQPQVTLTPLQTAMRQKLTSSRFRHLNQTLYTVRSSEAQELFTTNPSFFEEYHAGFRQQVSSWPENPVDAFLSELKQRAATRAHQNKARHTNPHDQSKPQMPSLPRTNGVCNVADLGCGDARLATELQNNSKKLNVKITSFDLHSDNPLVTKADISNLPLENSRVNIAIFCLALMGTNWIEFVEEAWRVLAWKGELWIAEIKSRFARVGADRRVDHSVGKKRKVQSQPNAKPAGQAGEDEGEQLRVEVDGGESKKEQTDVSAFVTVLERRGFIISPFDGIDLSNKMFVRMRFVKSKSPTKGKHAAASSHRHTHEDQDNPSVEAAVLKPCLYKTR